MSAIISATQMTAMAETRRGAMGQHTHTAASASSTGTVPLPGGITRAPVYGRAAVRRTSGGDEHVLTSVSTGAGGLTYSLAGIPAVDLVIDWNMKWAL